MTTVAFAVALALIVVGVGGFTVFGAFIVAGVLLGLLTWFYDAGQPDAPDTRG